MKWCFLDCYEGYPAWVQEPYKVTIKCDDYLYSCIPDDGSYYYIRQADPDGYDSLDDIGEILVQYRTFDPNQFNIFNMKSDWLMQPSVLANDWASPILSMFGFDSNEVVQKSNWSVYYQIYNDQNSWALGDNNFGGGERMTQGLFAAERTPDIGWDNLWFDNAGGNPHFWYEFDIYPERFISSGVYASAAFSEPLTPAAGYGRGGRVVFNLWQDVNTGKYNFEIYVKGYDKNLNPIIDNLDGKATGKILDMSNPVPEDGDDKNKGGYGPGDDINDPVIIPSLPGSDMTSTGSLRIYTVSAAQVKQLFEYLHSHDPAVSVMKWWSNPMQAIISLHYLPYAIRHKGSAEELKILGTPTGITMQPAEQFQTIHFGHYDLAVDSNTYLDFAPYTKVSIYLPGIGIRELNTDDVMGQRIWVVYHCDNCTGQFMAFVAIGKTEAKASVRYTFSGSVAASFPLTQENWGNVYIAAATMAAGAIGGGVAQGAAAMTSGESGSKILSSTIGGAMEGAGISGPNIGNSINSLSKPTITRSGTVSGTTSLFSVKKPYLIVERPDYQSFAGFADTKGYPCGTYYPFSKLSGYTVIEAVNLVDIPATVTELNEIESLLKSGVHF